MHFVTVLGTLRLRIARTRGQGFLPAGLEEFQRRAQEVSLLIREALLRGTSTRRVVRGSDPPRFTRLARVLSVGIRTP